MASEKNHSSAAEAETLLPADCNQNVYEDQSTGAELTRKDINRVAWRSCCYRPPLTMSGCRRRAGCTVYCPH